MISKRFNPADAKAWIARGRRPEHAAILAEAWQRYPDLPPQAAAEDRLARMRERVTALRPVMDWMSRTAEEERQARNFAFTEERVARGDGDGRDQAILRAHSRHGYDWDRAVRYAWGWYAATAGWEPEARPRGCLTPGALAYEHGFADGGGNRDDLFDAARRAFEAPAPAHCPPDTVAARPRPSNWPKPTDEPRPARWSRRLLILGAPEAGLLDDATIDVQESALLLPILRSFPGHEDLTVIAISSRGFEPLDCAAQDMCLPDASDVDRLAGDKRLSGQLRALLAGCDFDDILIAAQGRYLALLDAHAAALPLCRTMERTRNTVLQQRAHLRTWLERGLSPGANLGAGHIRWGKAVKGLTGKLGEFTARYAGRQAGGGHRVVIETADGEPAAGYVTAQGEPLLSEAVIGNRAHLRKEMAARLRAFGAATRLAVARAPDVVHSIPID